MIPKKSRIRPKQRPLGVARNRKSVMRRAVEREAKRQSPEVAGGMLRSYDRLLRQLGREPLAADVAKFADKRISKLEATGDSSKPAGRLSMSPADEAELNRKMGILPAPRTIDTPHKLTLGASVTAKEAKRIERAARTASPAPGSRGAWSKADEARMNSAMGIDGERQTEETPFKITFGGQG